MKPNNLKQIVDQLETLNQEELQELNQIIQQFLFPKERVNPMTRFHQSLLDTGLVKQIKYPGDETLSEHSLIQVTGKPVSETIIEERR